MEVTVKPRRPLSLPLIWEVFPDHSSFSVFRETPMAFSRDYFKKLNGHSGHALRKLHFRKSRKRCFPLILP